MLDTDIIKNINIKGYNIVKDKNSSNLTDVFSNSYSNQEYNNLILNNQITLR